MPNVETPLELAAAIADMVGIYSTYENPERRSDFEVEMSDRIIRAVKNLEMLEQYE